MRSIKNEQEKRMTKPDWQVREEQKLIEKFTTDATVNQGVVRWNSNNNVPPTDVLNVWALAGLKFDLAASIAARRIDEAEFIRKYREAQFNCTPEQIRQERLEARAALGPGEEVVNVITGERFRT